MTYRRPVWKRNFHIESNKSLQTPTQQNYSRSSSVNQIHTSMTGNIIFKINHFMSVYHWDPRISLLTGPNILPSEERNTLLSRNDEDPGQGEDLFLNYAYKNSFSHYTLWDANLIYNLRFISICNSNTCLSCMYSNEICHDSNILRSKQIEEIEYVMMIAVYYVPSKKKT